MASKHGVVGFTKAVGIEHATQGTGVTVNAVCPGWVLTPLVAKQVEARAQELNLTFEEAKVRVRQLRDAGTGWGLTKRTRLQVHLLKEKQPSGQFATPEQVGGVVAFLCTDAASQITATSLPVDGGWTAQ